MASAADDTFTDLPQDGQIDATIWPTLLPRILARLTHIAQHTFPGPLHPGDATTLTTVTTTLTTTFPTAPPHTIQRLLELLDAPETHYKHLPKFLRAVQRVVSVSSPTTAFPLLPAEPAVTNGATFGLGSDEGLGGALLTPIPWLVAGDAEGRALSPEEGDGEVVVEKRAKTPPPLGAEDVGKQPEGTRFGDPPRSEDEIVEKEKEEVVGGELEKEEEVGGKEEEMLDAGEEEMRDAGEEEEKEKKKEKE